MNRPFDINRLSAFSADPPASSGGTSILGSLFQATGVTSNLPSQQEIIQDYLMAVAAFWAIGGLTLYVIKKLK